MLGVAMRVTIHTLYEQGHNKNYYCTKYLKAIHVVYSFSSAHNKKISGGERA